MRPFRFMAPMPRFVQPVSRWLDEIRRIEDLGFSSVYVSEHLTRGWVMEPLVALTAAAGVTSRLRLLTLVLSNDFRHPVLVHKAAAMLDVLSSGRVELGIGAGWLSADYAATGVPMASPRVRIERLEESVSVLKGLFGATPFSYEGAHYSIRELDGIPKPIQQPHPPILVGGGGQRVLAVAGRSANIVGVHCRLPDGTPTKESVSDLSAPSVATKVEWVRSAAVAAGRVPEDIELQFSMYLVAVGDRGRTVPGTGSTFGSLIASDPDLAATSPAVLVGSVDACVDKLRERRDRYGFSYLNLGGDVMNIAPIVARLAGT